MTWVLEKHRYQKLATAAEPTVTITTKDSKFWVALWVFLVTITLGLYAIGMRLGRFLKEFATTVGPVQGYPREWPRLSERTIVHECRHTSDIVFLGWFIPILGWITRKMRAWVGLVPAGLIYGVLPFPILLCYGRYKMELRADEESYRWMLKNGFGAEEVKARAASFAETVGSGAYFWPWPKPLVRRGFKAAAERVIREHHGHQS